MSSGLIEPTLELDSVQMQLNTIGQHPCRKSHPTASLCVLIYMKDNQLFDDYCAT